MKVFSEPCETRLFEIENTVYKVTIDVNRCENFRLKFPWEIGVLQEIITFLFLTLSRPCSLAHCGLIVHVTCKCWRLALCLKSKKYKFCGLHFVYTFEENVGAKNLTYKVLNVNDVTMINSRLTSDRVLFLSELNTRHSENLIHAIIDSCSEVRCNPSGIFHVTFMLCDMTVQSMCCFMFSSQREHLPTQCLHGYVIVLQNYRVQTFHGKVQLKILPRTQYAIYSSANSEPVLQKGKVEPSVKHMESLFKWFQPVTKLCDVKETVRMSCYVKVIGQYMFQKYTDDRIDTFYFIRVIDGTIVSLPLRQEPFPTPLCCSVDVYISDRIQIQEYMRAYGLICKRCENEVKYFLTLDDDDGEFVDVIEKDLRLTELKATLSFWYDEILQPSPVPCPKDVLVGSIISVTPNMFSPVFEYVKCGICNTRPVNIQLLCQCDNDSLVERFMLYFELNIKSPLCESPVTATICGPLALNFFHVDDVKNILFQNKYENALRNFMNDLISGNDTFSFEVRPTDRLILSVSHYTLLV